MLQKNNLLMAKMKRQHIIRWNFYQETKKQLTQIMMGKRDILYYIKTNSSDMIQLILADSVKEFVKPDIASIVSKAVNDNDLLAYKDMTVTVGDKKYVLSETSKKEKVKKKDSDDKEKSDEETVYHYKYNGKDVKLTSSAEALYNNFMSLETQGEIKNKVKDNKPVAKIVYPAKDGKKDMTVEFLPYDQNFYRLKKDGSEYFLVAKMEIDKALDELKIFDPNKKDESKQD